jgi:prophage DNA circulation protein
MSKQRKIFTRPDGYIDVLVPGDESDITVPMNVYTAKVSELTAQISTLNSQVAALQAIQDEYYNAATYLAAFGKDMFNTPSNVSSYSHTEMIKYANGELEYRLRVLVQVASANTDVTTGTISFPVSFKSNTQPNIQVTPQVSGTSTVSAHVYNDTSYVTQRFSITVNRSTAANTYCFVVAKGRWK